MKNYYILLIIFSFVFSFSDINPYTESSNNIEPFLWKEDINIGIIGRIGEWGVGGGAVLMTVAIAALGDGDSDVAGGVFMVGAGVACLGASLILTDIIFIRPFLNPLK
jgi:hypothetical protein